MENNDFDVLETVSEEEELDYDYSDSMIQETYE